MPKFSIGDRVIQIQTGQKGIICEVCATGRGKQTYRVMFDADHTERCLEQHLDLIFNNDDPFELCKKGIYGNRDQFLLLNTTYKIINSNNNTISSLKASKTIFKAYQFKPLLKFLNSNSRRLLIADEVGLGKTIEAGHILLELKARNEFKSAIIICPNSLKIKWQTELKDKFGLDFKIYESLKDTIYDLQHHATTARGILNYEKVRVVRNYDDKEKISNELLDYMEESHKKFSIILCDEAHKMKNNETDTYRIMSKILDYTDTAVFLTATPIMLGEFDLYNLLHLLNPYIYNNRFIFRNLINSNRPFIEALSKINHQENLTNIKNNLKDAIVIKIQGTEENPIRTEEKIDDVYKNVPLYQNVLELLDKKDSLSLRAELQEKVSSLSVINDIFSRTRKKEISTDERQYTERRAHKINVILDTFERDFFDGVIDEYIESKGGYQYDEYGDEKIPKGAILGLVQKKRMVSSSVNAYKLYAESEYDKDKFLELVNFDKNSDSKIEELVHIINGIRGTGATKLVVFSIFKFTIKYLEIKLKKIGYNVYAIHGDIKEREKIIEEFKNNPSFSILLSTEVGSEGLDMQFCSHLVNFDLPWNPMVVEQRIGRIDRFGQESPSIQIYNFVVSDSIQEDIYDKLLMRIGIFQGAIGDLEIILEEMGDKLKGLEKDIFGTKLTPYEQRKKIRDLALAFENERIILDKIEEGLTNTLTNDIYFQDEISKIRERRLYVTSDELYNYLKMLIESNLTTCSLEKVSNKRFFLKVPKSDIKTISSFLYKWQPSGEEYDNLFKIYRNSLLDDFESNNKRLLTFDQNDAFENKEMDYVNIYNPLIVASSMFFKEKINDIGKTFQMKCKIGENLSLSPGHYYMGIYTVTTKRIILGKEIKNDELVSVIYNVSDDKTITDKDYNLKLFGYIQDYAEFLPTEESGFQLSEEACNNMQSDFTEYIGDYIENRKEEIRIKEESQKILRSRQTEEYYQPLIEKEKQNIKKQELKIEWLRDEKEIAKSQRNLRLARNRLKMWENAKISALEKINSQELPTLVPSLISLNKIKIV